jgi:hypothetical protein
MKNTEGFIFIGYKQSDSKKVLEVPGSCVKIDRLVDAPEEQGADGWQDSMPKKGPIGACTRIDGT